MVKTIRLIYDIQSELIAIPQQTLLLKGLDIKCYFIPYWNKKLREQKVAKSRNVLKNNWNKKSREQKVAELKVAWN